MCSVMIIVNVTKQKKRVPDTLKKLTIYFMVMWFPMFKTLANSQHF